MLKQLLASLVLLALVIVCSGSHAFADVKKEQGIKVAPLRTLVAHNPGNTSSTKIKITNETNHPAIVELTAENFNVTNEQYDYSFNLGESATWVRFVDQEITLKSGETKEVGYSLALPANATPGGYYIALVATNKEPESTVNINEVERVASLIYLEVVGDIVREGQMLSVDMPWFTSTGHVETSVRIANQGNIHQDSRVGVEYYPWPLKNSSHIQQLRALTLPNTTRQLSGTLSLGNIPGIYKLTFTYSPPQGSTQVQKLTIIYCPPWALLLLITLLGISIYKIYKLSNKLLHKIKQRASKIR